MTVSLLPTRLQFIWKLLSAIYEEIVELCCCFFFICYIGFIYIKICWKFFYLFITSAIFSCAAKLQIIISNFFFIFSLFIYFVIFANSVDFTLCIFELEFPICTSLYRLSGFTFILARSVYIY